MPEDPAVTRAKQLWNQQRQRDAILVLIKRINELNAFLDTTEQLPSRHISPTIARPVPVRLVTPKWLQWLKYIVLASIIISILLVIAYGLFWFFVKDRLVANVQLWMVCTYDQGQSDEFCEEWRDMVQENYGDDAKACARRYESALDSILFGACLESRGVPMPDEWSAP